jgi:hypothetical protein
MCLRKKGRCTAQYSALAASSTGCSCKDDVSAPILTHAGTPCIVQYMCVTPSGHPAVPAWYMDGFGLALLSTTYRPTGLPGAEPVLPAALRDDGPPQLLPVTATAATAAALWLLIASPSPLSR